MKVKTIIRLLYLEHLCPVTQPHPLNTNCPVFLLRSHLPTLHCLLNWKQYCILNLTHPWITIVQRKGENNHIRARQSSLWDGRRGEAGFAVRSETTLNWKCCLQCVNEPCLTDYWSNDWEDVQRNVGILWCEVSSGLRLTSFCCRESGWAKLPLITAFPCQCQQNWKDYCRYLTTRHRLYWNWSFIQWTIPPVSDKISAWMIDDVLSIDQQSIKI